MIYVYLVVLLIAPQLWIGPFVDLPVDKLLLPLWTGVSLIAGGLRRTLVTWFDIVFVIFMLHIVLSGAINGSLIEYLPRTLAYFQYFLIYRLVEGSISRLSTLKRVLLVFIVLTMFLAVESIVHKFSADGIGWAGQKLGWIDPDVLAAGGTGRTRWIGIFDGPGVFCVVFTVALGYLLVFVQAPHPLAVRVLAALAVALDLVATFYTGSRGGFLATMAALVIFVVLRQSNLTRIVSRFTWILPLLFVVLLVAPAHLTTMNDQSNSASHRIDMWAEGIDMVNENPVFGVGLGRFKESTGSLIAHNSSVEIMGETGFTGLFLWISLLYIPMKALWVANGTNESALERTYIRGTMVAAVGYVFSSLFVTLEYATYYIVLAVCIAAARTTGGSLEYSWRDMRNVFIIMCGWYLVLKIFLMTWSG